MVYVVTSLQYLHLSVSPVSCHWFPHQQHDTSYTSNTHISDKAKLSASTTRLRSAGVRAFVCVGELVLVRVCVCVSPTAMCQMVKLVTWAACAFYRPGVSNDAHVTCHRFNNLTTCCGRHQRQNTEHSHLACHRFNKMITTK